MNKIAIITDLHFGIKKNNDTFLENQIKFFRKQFIPYLKENSIKKICILGDIFDNRNSINTKVLNDVINLFEELNFLEKIYLIIGNHDSYLNTSVEITSIKFLEKYNNIHLMYNPEIVIIENKKILFVPWITDYNNFYDYFKKADFDVCMGHFDIAGFNLNKFETSKEGIPSDVFFAKDKLIFSGHFHLRSKQKKGNSEIIYIGSPYQMTRNDINEERGFCVLNLDDLSYENINNNISLKYIRLKYPQRFNEENIRGNIVDVQVDSEDMYDDKKIEKYLDNIENFNPIYKPNVFILNKNLESEFNFDDYNIGSILDLMKDYVETIDIKNKHEIYNILFELYNKTKGEL